MKIRATRLAVVAALTALGCGGPAPVPTLAPHGETVTGTSGDPSTTSPASEQTQDEQGTTRGAQRRSADDPQTEPSAARSGPALEVTSTSLKPVARDEDGVLVATHLFIRNVSGQPADAPLMRVRTHLLGDDGPSACALRSQHALGTLRDIAPGETRKVIALSVCERAEQDATAVGFVEFIDEGRAGPHFLGRVAIPAMDDHEPAASADPEATES